MIVLKVLHYLGGNFVFYLVKIAPCHYKFWNLLLMIGGWGIFNAEGEVDEYWFLG